MSTVFSENSHFFRVFCYCTGQPPESFEIHQKTQRKIIVFFIDFFRKQWGKLAKKNWLWYNKKHKLGNFPIFFNRIKKKLTCFTQLF